MFKKYYRVHDGNNTGFVISIHRQEYDRFGEEVWKIKYYWDPTNASITRLGRIMGRIPNDRKFLTVNEYGIDVTFTRDKHGKVI